MYYKGQKMDRAPALNTDFHGYGPSIRNKLAELIPSNKALSVLDIGTGMGSTARFLLDHLSSNSKIWSLDPSEEVISQAKEMLGSKVKRRRIKFVQGAADDLHFKDCTFDVVVSVMVLHHMESIEKPIEEAARVLKPAGRFIVIDFSPRAHTLAFQSRHAKEDFFTPRSVSRVATEVGLEFLVEDHGRWFVVECSKPVLKNETRR